MTIKEYEIMMGHKTAGMVALSTGICAGCEVCQCDLEMPGTVEDFEEDISTQEVLEEPWFSYESCDICNTNLGGDRVSGHYMDKNGDIVHLDNVCVDCMCYIANGDVAEYDPEGKLIV